MGTCLPELIFEGEIRDREGMKGLRPEVRVQGFDIFVHEFARALFRYGSPRNIHFTSEAGAQLMGSAPSWLKENATRCHFHSAFDLERFAAVERALLFSVGHEVMQFGWMRARVNRPHWPITAVLHSLSPVPRVRYFYTSSLLRLLRGYDALICPTRAAKAAMETLFDGVPEIVRGTSRLPIQLPVIPLGVTMDECAGVTKSDARRKHGISVEPVVFLYLGRISPVDKADLLPLLLAFSRLHNDSPVELVIAGDDTQFKLAAGLSSAAGELGCGARVKTIANVSGETKRELLAAADVFVAPHDNVQDTFPLNIAEAMSAGLPVIATDWNGQSELVEDGITGLLAPAYLPPMSAPWEMITLFAGVSPENALAMSTVVDIQALTAAMQTLAGDSQLRATMGAAASRFAASRLAWPKVIRQYEDLWDRQVAEAAAFVHAPATFVPASVGDVFRQYATRTVGADDRLSIPAGHRRSASTYGGRLFQPRVLAAIIEAVSTLDDPRVGSVTSAVCAALHVSPFEVERHVGRLLKYDAIRFHPCASREESQGEPAEVVCPHHDTAAASAH